MADISLALVTYNQLAYLKEFIRAYLRDGARIGIPLIVVDDGSTDGTADFLRGLEPGPGLRIESPGHVSAAHARNRALAVAETPWLAFSDTDCGLDRRYFEMLLEVPRRFAGYPAVEGAVAPPDGPRPPFTHSLCNLRGGMYATANMVFHVASAREAGGFDEAFPVNYREDVDLGLTLKERMGPIPFFPELRVLHPHVPRRVLPSLLHAARGLPLLVDAEMRLYGKHPATYACVRHGHTCADTLKSWCLRQTLIALRDCRRYRKELAAEPEPTGKAPWPGAAGQYLRALPVAAAEQAGFIILCALRWRRILALPSRPESRHPERAHAPRPSLAASRPDRALGKKRILVIWAGGVVPAYRSFFSCLASHARVEILSPRRWTHGSVPYRLEAGAGDPTAPGVRIVPTAFVPGGSRYFLPLLWWHLLRLRPSWVYVMDEPDRAGVVLHAALCRLLSPRARIVLYCLQNLERPSYHRRRHRLAIAANRRLVHLAVAASTEAAGVLRRHGFAGPVAVIPLSASPHVFRPASQPRKASLRRRSGLDGAPSVLLLFAGSLCEAKGLRLLASVLPAFPHIRLAAAGDGPLRDFLRERLGGQFRHLGCLRGKELVEFYQMGDYVILPSLEVPGWKEQVGRALIEGILCGCVALGSDSGYIPELTLFPQTRFRSNDASDLRRLLARLPLAEEAAVRLSQRAHVLANFTSEICAQRTWSFFCEWEGRPR